VQYSPSTSTIPEGQDEGPSVAGAAFVSAFAAVGAGFAALDEPAVEGGLLLGSAAAPVTGTGAGSGGGSLGRAAEQATEKRTPRSGKHRQHEEERFIADDL
jgi:hypothetical protein